MSVCRSVGLLATAAALLASCGTVEDNAWTSGIARADAYAIRDVVRAAHPGCRIDGYSLDPNRPGYVYCYTSCEPYLLHRGRRGWEMVGVAVIIV
jgi:hypothetical protein